MPACHDTQPKANPRALQTSLRRSALRVAIQGPKLIFDTVMMLCKFTAHGYFNPSASLNWTSEGTPRILDVIGATVTFAR